MVTESDHEARDPAPPTDCGDRCPDPSEAFDSLRCFYAHDVLVAERRKLALDDMEARIAAVSGIQVAYEDAIAAQRPVLKQLLEDLKAIRKTVECQVTDRQDDLIHCFCERIAKESGGFVELSIPKDPCPDVGRLDGADLEGLRTTQVEITRAIDKHKKELDDLTTLPTTVKAAIEQLAAKVKDLNTRICEKTIDADRAFVMQLRYRRDYVDLRHRLTDSRTYVCRIFDLLDEIFALYKWDACVAGAIGWLEKAKELEDARKQSEDAENQFIDDVLRCSKPKDPTKPSDDDGDDVDALDPCRCVEQLEPCPEESPQEEGSHGAEGATGEPSSTSQPSPTEQRTPTGEQSPTEDREPRSGG